MPWLRQLGTGLSLREPDFAPGSVRVIFVVVKVALEHDFLKFLDFPLSVSFIRCSLYSYITWG
jgi:hypothetical protein